MTPEEYKASLPTKGPGVVWTMESFSTYVQLLYPHVTVVPGQEWTGNRTKYALICEDHGQYTASAYNVLNPIMGCQCRWCQTEVNKALAGKRRCPRATEAEKRLAAELFAECGSYRGVARQMGRHPATIQHWLDPEYAQRKRESNTQWHEENREQSRASARRYSTFDHGKAVKKKVNTKRRIRKLAGIEHVFLDGKWFEVDMAETSRIWGDLPYSKEESDALTRLEREAALLTNDTGVEYHLDHIWPISLGGSHSYANLQLLPAEENLIKNNKFREEDQEELCRRLFSINELPGVRNFEVVR